MHEVPTSLRRGSPPAPSLGIGVVFELIALNESKVFPTTCNYKVVDSMDCLHNTYNLRPGVQLAAQLTVGSNEDYHAHANI